MVKDEKPSEIASPCLAICTLDPGNDVCTGCWRTRAEIWAWTRCSDERKQEILESAARRRFDLAR